MFISKWPSNKIFSWVQEILNNQNRTQTSENTVLPFTSTHLLKMRLIFEISKKFHFDQKYLTIIPLVVDLTVTSQGITSTNNIKYSINKKCVLSSSELSLIANLPLRGGEGKLRENNQKAMCKFLIIVLYIYIYI